MNFSKYSLYSKNQISYDLYNKFLYLNFYDLPKILNVSISISSLKYKKKKLLIYILALFLALNQKPLLSIKKNKNSNYKLKKIKLDLNKFNLYFFLDNFINIYFSQFKNLKKLNNSFFQYGNLNYKLFNLSILVDETILKLINFRFNFNIRILSNTKNIFISKVLFNLYLFPILF